VFSRQCGQPGVMNRTLGPTPVGNPPLAAIANRRSPVDVDVGYGHRKSRLTY